MLSCIRSMLIPALIELFPFVMYRFSWTWNELKYVSITLAAPGPLPGTVMPVTTTAPMVSPGTKPSDLSFRSGFRT